MENVEDFYPLSPLQEGMLFETLYSAGSGLYVTQLNCLLTGRLDPAAFRRAWHFVAVRHAALRAFFVWEGVKRPVQVVPREFDIPLEDYDWRHLTADQQAEQLDAYLRAERARGFTLSKPPLMRLALMRQGEEEHRFVWSFHHLLLDGWSISLLFKDLLATYGAFARGQEPRLPAARPYRDYIAWIQRQDGRQAEEFWREYLKGFDAPTPLPAGRRREATGERRARTQHQLSPELTSSLQAFARQSQLTLSTIAHGAWALLLARHAGVSDVLFGSIVSGRPHDLAGVESMIGLFINTLPVRIRVEGEREVLPWLKSLQAQQAQARQFEHSSLVQVHEWSEVPRGLPLFESAVAYENYPVESALSAQQGPGGGLQISRARTTEQVDFPLCLMVIPGARLTLNVYHDARFYDEAAAARLLRQYEAVLESLAAAIPRQRLSDVRALPAEERRQLLFEWNRTSADYAADRCAHELFEERAAEHPDATALVAGVERVSYSDLNRRANRLARYLRARGVGAESRVGLMLERGAEMVVGLLAVLKAGGAYVPLDPDYPAERLRYMLDDARVSVLLTRQSLAGERATGEFQVVCVDADAEAIAREAEDNPRGVVNPANLAYLIYTSGSTGRPKGVMLEHKGLPNLSEAQVRALGVRAGQQVLQFCSLSFDASIFDIVMALCVGSTLHLLPRESLLGDSLVEELSSRGITNILIPPSILLTLPAAELPALQTLIVGGEACPPELVARWAPGRRFFNAYGPTESTVWATLAECSEGERRPNIGRPVLNTQVYLLDEQLEPVPVGVAAELYVGGVGLARGYFGRPAATAERFLPNSFSAEPGARLYRTGDFARYLPDGEIEYLGRADNQVKVRGFRVELGEIEAALSQHSSVESATVVARAQRLVGYVVGAPGATPSPAELRGFLQQKLPPHMVPASIVMLDAWPLTPNGKIDRKALPDPEPSRPQLEVSYVAPQTELERAVVELWQKVLGVEQVGLDDNFFDLGGHSLLMLQVHGKVQALCGKKVPLVELFEFPTVRAMVARLAAGDEQEVSFGGAEARAQKQREVLARRRQLARQRPAADTQPR